MISTLQKEARRIRSPWPFDGLFGDAHDGGYNITAATTETKFRIEASNFTIDNATYTVKQQNPGGVLIACTGTFKMTSGAILDCNGQGSAGGTALTAGSHGKSGAPGKGFAGRAANGGGDGTNAGGQGGPLLVDLFGSFINVLDHNLSKDVTSAAGNEPYRDIDATTITYQPLGMAMHRSWFPARNSGTGAGLDGDAWSGILDTTFDMWSALDLIKILGFGSGGGSGAWLAGTSGAGGAGGGLVLIVCNELDFKSGATIRVAGAAGAAGVTNSGGGGGGGGGCIVILYRTLTTNAGTLTVSGGAAGAGAGAGGTAGGAGGAGYSTVVLI